MKLTAATLNGNGGMTESRIQDLTLKRATMIANGWMPMDALVDGSMDAIDAMDAMDAMDREGCFDNKRSMRWMNIQ